MIEAAALVGDLSRVGLITQLYDRRTVLGPHEPGELLMAERPPGDGSTLLPDDAEVCACAGVSAGRLRACADLDEARSTTRATTGCGGCTGRGPRAASRRAAGPGHEFSRLKHNENDPMTRRPYVRSIERNSP